MENLSEYELKSYKYEYWYCKECDNVFINDLFIEDDILCPICEDEYLLKKIKSSKVLTDTEVKDKDK